MGAAKGAVGEAPAMRIFGESAEMRAMPHSKAQACLAKAVRLLPDFSKLLPADYREKYAAWRSGGSQGAKGEPCDAATCIELHLPRFAKEVSLLVGLSWP